MHRRQLDRLISMVDGHGSATQFAKSTFLFVPDQQSKPNREKRCNDCYVRIRPFVLEGLFPSVSLGGRERGR